MSIFWHLEKIGWFLVVGDRHVGIVLAPRDAMFTEFFREDIITVRLY